MITIVDYKMGNLRSVQNALSFLGYESRVSGNPDEIADSGMLILPGVGSFREAMKNIRGAGLEDALNEAVLNKKRPILGICLGMQLLASEGTEDGITKGLDWIPGTVQRFQFNDPSIRLPHIGFNSVYFKKTAQNLSEGLSESADFYFVHSYHFVCEDKYVAGETDYQRLFVSSVKRDNICGTQFHPEKSQFNGLRVLKNFIEMYSDHA